MKSDAANSAETAGSPKAFGDFVYFARGRESGFIKVGLSINPETRIKQLGCGEPVELLFVFPATYAIEQAIHTVFRMQPGAWAPRGTEWYQPTTLIADCISVGLEIKNAQAKRNAIMAEDIVLRLVACKKLNWEEKAAILGLPWSESTLRRLYGDN